MPELPEVENLRIGLEKKVLGQRVKKVTVRHPKLVSGSGNARRASTGKTNEFIRGLTGETISAVERCAKNLIFRFKSGKVLLAHLKMSGQFVHRSLSSRSTHPGSMNSGFRVPPSLKLWRTGKPGMTDGASLPGKHTHIIFELSRGTLYYNDIRAFGYLLYFKDDASFKKANHFKNIGPEPLSQEFTLEYFRSALKNKKTRLKALLLGQSAVAGLGNIYADEACFEAGIKPTSRANSLKKEEVKKLYLAIKRILAKAVKLGGSSVATYMLLDESRGNYAREHKVYGRAGEKCFNCGKILTKITTAGRTTVFCADCQN